MSTEDIQVLLSGVMTGALYGIAALGLSLVFGVLKVLNIAHGELVILGGYASWWLYDKYHYDPYVSLLLVIPLLFIVGAGLYLTLFWHVVRSDEEHRIKNSLLIGFGLSLIAQTLATRYFSGDPRAIPYSANSWEILGLQFPLKRASNLVIGIVVVMGLQWFMYRTYIGKAIRATAEDWQTAGLTGINVRNMYLITFSLGSALAGLAGMLLSIQQSLTPTTGLRWTLNALIVIVLAGLGSIPGTFIAGMLLGLTEASSTLIFGSNQYREMAGLVIFVVILSVRSQGLFGEQHV